MQRKSRLVTNESYQYYKTRLPNEYLISGNVYISKEAHGVLVGNLVSDRSIEDAINENQFSTGAINRLYEMINQAKATNISRPERINNLKKKISQWLTSIDSDRAIID